MKYGEDECATCSGHSHMEIRANVEASWDRIDAVLTFKGETAVIRAVGDKAEVLGNESGLYCSPSAKGTVCHLADAYGRIGTCCTLPNADARGY